MRRLHASRDGFARGVIDLCRATAHQDSGRIEAREQIIEALAVHSGATPSHTATRVHRTILVYATVRVSAVSLALTHAALSVIAQATACVALSGARLCDAALSFSFASCDCSRVASGGCDTSIFCFFTTLYFVRERQVRGCCVCDTRAAGRISGRLSAC